MPKTHHDMSNQERLRQAFAAQLKNSPWPPRLDSEYGADCWRGVLVDTVGHRQRPLETAAAIAKIVDQIENQSNESGASRIQIKVFATPTAVKAAAKDSALAGRIEAVIPLAGAGDGFDKLTLTYLAINSPDRRSHNLAVARAAIRTALQTLPRPLPETIARIPPGFTIRQFNESDLDQHGDSLWNLWRQFGFNQTEIARLVSNPSQLVTVAFSPSGELVSAGRADTSAVALSGKLFLMTEHTDAATDNEHLGQGLYAGVLASAMTQLNNQPWRSNLLYAESNTSSGSVLRVARQLGRRFALEFGPTFGLSKSGVLAQDIAIVSKTGQPKYKDLAPNFITQANLQEMVGAPLR